MSGEKRQRAEYQIALAVKDCTKEEGNNLEVYEDIRTIQRIPCSDPMFIIVLKDDPPPSLFVGGAGLPFTKEHIKAIMGTAYYVEDLFHTKD